MQFLFHIFSNACSIPGWLSSNKWNRKEYYVGAILSYILQFLSSLHPRKCIPFYRILIFQNMVSLGFWIHQRVCLFVLIGNALLKFFVLNLYAMMIQSQLLSDPFLILLALFGTVEDLIFASYVSLVQFHLASNLFGVNERY